MQSVIFSLQAMLLMLLSPVMKLSKYLPTLKTAVLFQFITTLLQPSLSLNVMHHGARQGLNGAVMLTLLN